jgi:hypothetical protein
VTERRGWTHNAGNKEELAIVLALQRQLIRSIASAGAKG